MTRELGKAQVHGAMELPHSVAMLIDVPCSQPDQFAQLRCHLIRYRSRHGSLLCCEPRDAERINRVGLRPLKFLFGEASRT